MEEILFKSYSSKRYPVETLSSILLKPNSNIRKPIENRIYITEILLTSEKSYSNKRSPNELLFNGISLI